MIVVLCYFSVCFLLALTCRSYFSVVVYKANMSPISSYFAQWTALRRRINMTSSAMRPSQFATTV